MKKPRTGFEGARGGPGSQTLHPTPYTLHPTPYTLHPTPYTLHPTTYNLHPTPYTLHPSPHTRHPTPDTRHPTPYTIHHTPYTLHQIPDTLHPRRLWGRLRRCWQSKPRPSSRACRKRTSPECRLPPQAPPYLTEKNHRGFIGGGISQEVLIQSFCKGQFPQKSVSFSLIIDNIKMS